MMPTQPDWSKIRSQFPTLSRKIYLNSCSLGLLSDRTRDAMNRYMDLWTEYGAAAWYSEWGAEIVALGPFASRLIFTTLVRTSTR